jgi:hypothetical protein
MRKLARVFFGAFLAIALLGQTKPSKLIPAELAHACYAALGYDLGRPLRLATTAV